MGCCGGSRDAAREHIAARGQATTATAEDPVAILKLRLAKGEITLEEYDRLAAVLNRAS